MSQNLPNLKGGALRLLSMLSKGQQSQTPQFGGSLPSRTFTSDDARYDFNRLEGLGEMRRDASAMQNLSQREFGGSDGAFATARRLGAQRFTWRDRDFTTELATTADRVDRGTPRPSSGVTPVEAMMVDPEDELNTLMGTDGFTGGTMDMPMQPAQRGRITYTAEGPEVLVTADRMQPTQPMDQAEAMSGYTSQVSPQTRQQAEDFFQRPLQQLSDNLMRESLSPDPFIENAQEAARGITYTGEGPELNVTGQRITEPRPDRVPEVDNGLAQSMQSALTAFSAGGRLDDQSINDLMLRYIQAGFDPAQVSLIIRALVPNLLDQSAVEGVRQSPQQRPQRPLQQLSDNLMRNSLSPLFGN
jgi:hypothetical protein